ncbi:OmpA family protein [Bacteroidales bacterium OttesenSCG-928-M06]|nr:OmpA family protein [Bacteroidales bacterium OttesenSCG-928-M06]
MDSDNDGVPDYLDKCADTLPGVAVNKDGCPLDSDGDGIPDYLDKCANTPAGVAVDENGCPIDSDGDGIPDYLDKCADTPEGVKVDKNGCPVDSDGDGIADYLDKCPDTPKGVKVDENGCPIEIIPEITEKVLFDTGKYTIKSASFSTLDEIVNILNSIPDVNVKIQGHTDSVGEAKMNMTLSNNRANAVKNYLVKKGIDKDRITTEGFGYSKPIADNATEEGRTQNRRVNFILEQNK